MVTFPGGKKWRYDFHCDSSETAVEQEVALFSKKRCYQYGVD